MTWNIFQIPADILVVTFPCIAIWVLLDNKHLSPPAPQSISVFSNSNRMLSKSWTRTLNLIPVLVGLKLWTASRGVLYPSPPVPQTSVANHSSSLIDPDSGTSQVTDRRNVSFLLQPQNRCGENTTLVLFALSALSHRSQRQALRRSFGQRDNVSLIFLVAEAESDAGQLDLYDEHLENDDLLQVRHWLL